MTESIKKAENITHVPILCTPEMVLLPFENQSLKIQTAAHRQLIKDVAHGNKFFGLIFFDKKTAASDRPEIGSVGCIAELKRIKLSSAGGKIADITGSVRYQIEGYNDTNEAYPAAEVSFVEDEPEDVEMLRELSLDAEKIIRRVIAKGRKQDGKQPDEAPMFQSSPVLVSFLLADLFNMDNPDRQLFLNSRLASERLKICRDRLLGIEDGTDEMLTRQQFLKPFYSNKHK